MFGSDMLEVGIGLSLLFLLMSLICTALRETLEALLKSRGKDLARGIRELLQDPTGTGVAKDFFQHPLIFGLFKGNYAPPKKDSLTGKIASFFAGRNLPSYIPASHFATALLDLVTRGPVLPGGTPNAAASVISIDSLRASAAAITNPAVQRAVLSSIDMAQGDLDKAKANIEDWYNGTMDRVSGWYKRRTQAILFVMGFLAAALLNVDSIHIAERLNTDKALRQAAVAQASTIVGPGNQGQQQGDTTKLAEMQKATQQQLTEDLRKIGYPIGWSPTMPQVQAACGNVDCRLRCIAWLKIFLGWLVTALAITLGAPFWFDVLNKFMVVRSTVKPHEKSPEEGSEDRQTGGDAKAGVPRPSGGGGGGGAPLGGAAAAAAVPPPANVADLADLKGLPYEELAWAHGGKEGVL